MKFEFGNKLRKGTGQPVKLKGKQAVLYGLLFLCLIGILAICAFVGKKEAQPPAAEIEEEIENSVRTFLMSYSLTDGFKTEIVGNTKELYEDQVQAGEAKVSKAQVDAVASQSMQAYKTLTTGRDAAAITEKMISTFEKEVKQAIVNNFPEAPDQEISLLQSGVTAIIEKYIVAQMSSADEAVALLQTEIDLINRKMNDQQVDDWQVRLEEITSQMKEAQEKLEAFDSAGSDDGDELKQEMTTVRSNVARSTKVVVDLKALQKDVANSKITELDKKLTALEQKLEELNKSYQTNTADFDKLQKQIDALQATMDAKDKDLSTQIAKLKKELADDIGKNAEEIEDLQEALSDYKKEVTEQFKKTNAAISALQEKDSTIISRLDALNSTFSNMQSEYKQIITGITGDVQQLQKDLDDLSKNLAASDQKIVNIEETIKNIKNESASGADLTELERRVAAVEEEVNACFQSVSNGKTLLASAISDKGVQTDATATFADMANNIKAIGAEGNVTSFAMLEGFRGYTQAGYRSGAMNNLGKIQDVLAAGEEVTFDEGYAEGGAIVAQDLASQTPADAVAENLPAGKTAWVNGLQVTGNGKDIQDAYDKGYTEGAANALAGLSVAYTYHTHSGSAASGGGCYSAPIYHKHIGNAVSGGSCYTAPVYHVHTGSAASGGGCYMVPVYHVHTGSTASGGGCYTTPIYHQHTDACYVTGDKPVVITSSTGDYNDYGHSPDTWCNHCSASSDHYFYTHVTVTISSPDGLFEDITVQDARYDYCNNCNYTELNFAYNGSNYKIHGSGASGAAHRFEATLPVRYIGCGKTESTIDSYALGCGKNTSSIDSYALGCGKTESTVDSYALGCGKTESSLEGYELGCGKTERTIESATIVFSE